MSTDDSPAPLQDAIALTTNLLYQQTHGEEWSESLLLAREIATRDAEGALMAQAHLMVKVLEYVTEVVQAAGQAGVEVTGVPGGVSPETLLQELGRQVTG